jgi:hypothetical protein
MEIQPSRCTLLSFDDPTHVLKNTQDMGPLDGFHRFLLL